MMLSALLLLQLLLLAVRCATPNNTPAHMIEIFNRFTFASKDIVEVIVNDETLFDDCMRHQDTSMAIRLFHEAFILEKGVIHKLATNENDELAHQYFHSCIRPQSQAAKHLTLLYINCDSSEQSKISNYFRARESWLPLFKKFVILQRFARMLGEPVGEDNLVPFTTCLKVGLRIYGQEELVKANFYTSFFYSMVMEMAAGELHNCKEVFDISIIVAKNLEREWPQITKLVTKVFKQGHEKSALTLLVKWLSKIPLVQYGDKMIDFNKRPKKHMLILQEAIKRERWTLASMLLSAKLSPRLYTVLKAVDTRLYSVVLSRELKNAHQRPTLLMFYYMSRFLVGQELPAVTEYLQDILKIKNYEERTIHTVDGFPICSLPEEIISKILYESIDSLAYSELVLKRVCKKWNQLLVADNVVVNSLRVARQFIASMRNEKLRQPWKSFTAIRQAKCPIFVSILSTWPADEFNMTRKSVENLLRAMRRFNGADPVLLARMIMNLAIHHGPIFKESHYKFAFPETFTRAEISSFTIELFVKSSCPIGFEYQPEFAIQMLDSLTVDGEFPASFEKASDQIVKQASRAGIPLKVFLEYRIFTKYSRAAIRKLYDETHEQDTFLLPLVQGQQRYDPAINLSTRFIARYVMEHNPHVNLNIFSDFLLTDLVCGALLEAGNEAQFDAVLAAILRSNTLTRLNEYFLDGISELLAEKIKITDIN